MKIDERFITPEVVATARRIAKQSAKKGWRVNPDNKMFTVAIKGLINNGGDCPAIGNDDFKLTQCPCHSYTARNICFCGLYVKSEI